MKSYEELTAEALERAAVKKKERRRRIGITSTIVTEVCIVLAATLVIGHMNGLSEYIFPEKPASAEVGVGVMVRAEEYEKIFDLLYDEQSEKDGVIEWVEEFFKGESITIGGVPELESSGMDVATDSLTDSVGGTNDFSSTNIQVEGIMEADCVKCDGEYIYSASSENLYIIKAEDGELETVSRIGLTNNITKGNSYTNGIYVYGDLLVLVGNLWTYSDDADKTYACIYDVSDKAQPKYVNTLYVSGSYADTRMENGELYIITNQYLYGTLISDTPETYIPSVGFGDEVSVVSSDCIFYEPEPMAAVDRSYINIVSLDVEAAEVTSSLSLLGCGGSDIYQSADNLYISQLIWQEDREGVKLMRIATDGELTLDAEGYVDGYLLNSFSMDEWNGHFRVVTTEYTDTGTKNGLHILDMDLNEVGSIKDLAPEERVYSVRFDGDIAYFVTFREMDPLFCADVSDPTAPKILSELKIPGFSEYLHKYTDNLLFGLGNAAVGNGNGGYTRGNLKLSMFDVTDKTNVTEAASLVLNGVYYSEATYDHHAILVDSAKGLIAFACETEYYVYTYENGEFRLLETLELEEYATSVRGIYIGDHLYICEYGRITSYSLDGFAQIDRIELDDGYGNMYYLVD